MKVKLTTNLELSLLQQGKDNHLNFAEILEEAVRNKLNFLKGDINGINIELTKLELERDERKQTKLNNKITQLKDIIVQAEEVQKKKVEETLKKEREQIEAAKKCINCGEIIQGRSKHFKNGNVCINCFLTSAKDNISKWVGVQ